MRFAIFSDIHANLEALETAVDYAQGRDVERTVVLGDTVGYGADPNACFEWAVQNTSIFLIGNHERGVVDPLFRDWFNDWAREAIVWTAGVMDPALKKTIPDLPYLKIENGLTFAHGSPDDPEKFRYLLTFSDAGPSFSQFENSICFVGHTHIPCCFCLGRHSAEYLKPGTLTLESKERYILNPGSVGQPRDRDPRLSFGIYDDEKRTFEIVRLPYDNEKAAGKIRRAWLPRYLADRLL